MSILYSPWTSQPQQAVNIDWSNPITRGLVTAIVPIGGKHRDIAKTATAFSYTGTHIPSVASGGVGVRNNTVTAANKVTINTKTETVGSITVLYAICVHQIGGATYPFFRNNQTHIFASGTSGPTWGFRAGVGTNVFSSTPIKLNQFTSVAFAQSGTTAQLAVDGAMAYEDYSGGSNALISTSAIDANPGFTQSNDFTLYQCLIWDRGLSKAELKSLTANPWQIFKPLPRRIFAPVSAGGGTTAVTADHNASYTITGSAAADASAAYAIRAAVTADATASYALRAAVAADSSASYALRTSATAGATASYAIRSPVASDLSSSYAIQTAGTVAAGLDATYSVRGSVAGDISVGYKIAAAVQAEVTAAYAVRAAVQKDLSAWYSVSDSVTNVASDIVCTYAINGVSPSYPSAESIADAVRTMLLANPALIADPVWTKALP